MLHNSYETETILPSDWLILFLSKFQYGKNEDNTPQGGDRKDVGMMMRAWTHARMEVKSRAQVLAEAQGPPSPAQEIPPDPEEIIRRIAEAEQLEEVGRSP